MKRIGMDVAEKLDYTPGTFSVESHIRGRWACVRCETLVPALTRLPTQPQSRIGELLPHRWKRADGRWESNPTPAAYSKQAESTSTRP